MECRRPPLSTHTQMQGQAAQKTPKMGPYEFYFCTNC